MFRAAKVERNDSALIYIVIYVNQIRIDESFTAYSIMYSCAISVVL